MREPSGDNAKLCDAAIAAGNSTRRSGGGTGDRRYQTASAEAAASAIAPAAVESRDSEPRERSGGCAASAGCDNTIRASPMSRSRLGSCSRQRASKRRTAGGVGGGKCVERGVSDHCGQRSVRSQPRKRRRPVNISYSTTPNAQMSARSSTGLLACSGLMYPAVPRIIPSWVLAGRSSSARSSRPTGRACRGTQRLGQSEVQDLRVPSTRTLTFAGSGRDG